MNKNDITLAAKHQTIVEKFDLQQEQINKYNAEIDILKKLENIDDDNSKLTIKEMNNKFDIKDEINSINEKINKIKNKSEEDDYYVKTSHLLFHYYNNLDVNNDNTSNNDSFFWGDDIDYEKESDQSLNKESNSKEKDLEVENDIKNDNSKNLKDFFNISINNSNNDLKSNKNTKNTEKKIKKNNITNTRTTKISKFVTTTESFNRRDVLDKYMKIVDSSYICSDICTDDNSIFYCSRCNIEKKTIHSEGYVVCDNCGDLDHIIIDSEKPSYKEPPVEISYFAYKRINHFNEWLAQFQAKESTEISQEILDMILVEIKKSRIKNMAVLTHSKLREILKKLKLNKYYEHVPHIINRLNGLPPPVISRDIEEKLRIMFKEIQNPFLKVCPKGRKNFLSYSYVLHKFVELLSLDDLLPCFPLLKSREKLHQQDKIWKDICYELQWEFIKSV